MRRGEGGKEREFGFWVECLDFRVQYLGIRLGCVVQVCGRDFVFLAVLGFLFSVSGFGC